MSNRIRYDSLLVHYLAVALDERLFRRRIEALALEPDRRRATLVLGDESLVLDLHPTSGAVLLGPAPTPEGTVRLARRTTVTRVVAPPDERVLIVELSAAGSQAGRPKRLVVELLGNQYNLLVLDPADRILVALWKRSAGERELRPGARYVPPPPTDRLGAETPIGPEEWRALLGPVPPPERKRTLIEKIAWTSPINAEPILGSAAQIEDDSALMEAYARYHALASRPPESPHVLETERGAQPYPLPLPGVPARPCGSLTEAMAIAVGEKMPATVVMSAEMLERLRQRIEQLERRVKRLASELEDAGPEAARLRTAGDLLLSQLHLVTKGASSVEVSDFQGGSVRIELDPSLTPIENAHRLYDLARKRERAAEQLPALLKQARSEHARLSALLERAEAGEADPTEIAAMLPDISSRDATTEAPLPPYRTYRTSGGLEVRVGRGGKHNDELTFHHSAPNDIWLHARDVGGAHVILRWGDANANPPARDLAEAATLAALHSKARTSGTVAVDWTRRKYVRKPRKSPPGFVAFERAKTVFVEPDEALEKAMRPESPGW